jgi:hypothetical protein
MTKEHKTLVEAAKSLRELWKQFLQGEGEERKKENEDSKQKTEDIAPDSITLQHTVSSSDISQIGRYILHFSQPIKPTGPQRQRSKSSLEKICRRTSGS